MPTRHDSTSAIVFGVAQSLVAIVPGAAGVGLIGLGSPTNTLGLVILAVGCALVAYAALILVGGGAVACQAPWAHRLNGVLVALPVALLVLAVAAVSLGPLPVLFAMVAVGVLALSGRIVRAVVDTLRPTPMQDVAIEPARRDRPVRARGGDDLALPVATTYTYRS